MKPTSIAAALVLAIIATPTFAQSPTDAAICIDDDAAEEERFPACSRLIAAGVPGTDDEPALYLYARARIAYYGDDREQAIVDLQRAIVLDPENDELHNLLGHAFLFTEQWEESRAAFEEAIRLSPDVSWRRARLGFVLTRLGDFDGALASLDEALRLDPESTLALYYRARLHTLAERPDEAIADFTTAIAVDPFNDDFYVGRGQIYFRAGDSENTLHDYRIANLLNPNRIGEGFLNDNWPAREAPVKSAPVNWAPPEPGLVITYVEVINEELPPVDPMQAAIDALVAWFSTPELQTPFGRHFYRFEVGDTYGTETAVVNTDLYGTMERPPVVNQSVGWSLFASSPLGEDLVTPTLVGDSIGESIWPLEVGETVSGSGIVVVYCPEDPQPLAFGFGCQGDIEEVVAGDYEWTATIEGWEDVLTPAGRRMTIKITTEEIRRVTVLGREVALSAVDAWWFDPEINWWVKRETTERIDGNRLGNVITVEAISILTPG